MTSTPRSRSSSRRKSVRNSAIRPSTASMRASTCAARPSMRASTCAARPSMRASTCAARPSMRASTCAARPSMRASMRRRAPPDRRCARSWSRNHPRWRPRSPRDPLRESNPGASPLHVQDANTLVPGRCMHGRKPCTERAEGADRRSDQETGVHEIAGRRADPRNAGRGRQTAAPRNADPQVRQGPNVTAGPRPRAPRRGGGRRGCPAYCSCPRGRRTRTSAPR